MMCLPFLYVRRNLDKGDELCEDTGTDGYLL